jgi:hypothetical protein
MTTIDLQIKANHADDLSQAGDAVLAAVQEYRRVLAAGPLLESTEITYKASKIASIDQTYKIDTVNAISPYAHDHVLVQALNEEHPSLQALLLEFSPHWEDRIRAAALREHLHRDVTLPDGFPCIYEPAESPKRASVLNPAPFVWVASPDEEMLHKLLPLYRELWDSYENQWPHSENRQFVVGRLNGVSPRGVYRPGTTPAQVIGHTMLTHERMYGLAPAHLQQMHPRNARK